MKNSILLKILVLITFLGMITANILANTLPINGINTGAVSDSYPNLFAPAAITFSIWGVIYILLACYTLYQMGIFGKKDSLDSLLTGRINILFIVSSLANTIWIFMWHYQNILISVILMLVILICLIRINQIIVKADLTKKEQFWVKLPFGVYFGWITVATIANITTYLVSIGWTGGGTSEEIWTIIILIVGLIIAVLTTCRFKSVAYGLVIIWAYTGILIKHVSAAGFGQSYQAIIITLIISLVILVAATVMVLIKKKKK